MNNKPSWKNPGISQIAEEAGVSSATVDRVLNNRPGVREVTRRRVESALFRLGCSHQNTSEPVRRKIAFICEAGSSYLSLVEREARLFIRQHPEISFSLDSVPNVQVDAGRFSQTITRRAAECEGIILVSRDHLKVNRAVREAVDNGVCVLCLTTDLPNSRRSAYVGVDQISTGAAAGWYIGRLLPQQQPGNILLVYSSTYRTQEEREVGFRRVLRERFPWLNIVERMNINDESEGSYHSVSKFLAEHPPMVGIYNMAGGNRGIARALNEHGLKEKVVFIGHELSKFTRHLLESGEMDLVLGHDIGREIAICLELMNNVRAGETISSVKTALQVYNRYSWFP